MIKQPQTCSVLRDNSHLDGITLSGERIVEIKCPVRGRDSTLWKTVEAGRLPEYYEAQVQHQLMVTNAGVADVFVFDGAEGVLLEVIPQPETRPQIHESWDEFMDFVTKSEPPPLSERDVRLRDDPEWLEAAAAYLELKGASDELSAKLDEAKSRLVSMASHPREQGGGLSVTRLWKRGNIDYKRVPVLATIDLERYRGPGREELRVVVDHRTVGGDSPMRHMPRYTMGEFRAVARRGH